ncbi:hypothetical protein ACFVW1_26255 [Streptomyces olivochromogenes]|uniref:MmyB family transcriptional regulator n=1 Tax=Streptomyces olivochromogenes TaxID=1963 RepID=UPI0036DF2E73
MAAFGDTPSSRPDDPDLAELIGQLTMKSREFTSLWSEHRVRARDIATHRMRHPRRATPATGRSVASTRPSPCRRRWATPRRP